MDIQVLGDNKISRRNHGVIVFDPKKRETVLLSGDSNGLYETARWKDIEDCLEGGGSCQEKAYAIIELVNNSQLEERDNAAVVVLQAE